MTFQNERLHLEMKSPSDKLIAACLSLSMRAVL
jgi:hypothetical protein